MVISAAFVRTWLRFYREQVDAEADDLNRLDAALGDGDFGASMQRGLAGVMSEIDGTERSVAELLQTTGSTIVSVIGGTSGPLVGSFFLNAGLALGGTEEVSASEFASALQVGCDAVMALGGASVGDKTMIDALVPAIETLRSSVEAGSDFDAASSSAAKTAAQAAEATRELSARRGRASYTGSGGLDHVDPGARGVAILFQALATAAQGAATKNPHVTADG